MKREQKAAVLIIVQLDQPAFLWGSPGQGKSSFIRQGFSKLGYSIEVIRVNTVLPHHLSGTPVPNADGTAVRFLPPEWAVELNKAPKALFFLDDVSCASHTQQTAAMGLLDERKIGGLELKATPIAAANFNTLATARFSLDAAVSNRCIHVHIDSDADVYREDTLSGFAMPTVPVLRKNWERSLPVKEDLITRFLCSPEGQPVLNEMPQRVDEKTVAWPSERSWRNCMKVLAACDNLELDSIKGINLVALRSLLFKGCVGEGAFKKFNNYFVKPIASRVDEAMRHGKAFSFPENGDEFFGLLTAVTNKLSGESMSEQQWKQVCSLLEGAWETSHRDRAMTFAIDLLSLNQDRFSLPKFFENKVRPVLLANV